MQEFVMMIGLPGSGKDYFIEHNIDFKNYVIVSTDQIRKNNGYKQGAKNDVFQIAHNMIIDSLSLGKDVVFNATNLQRKFRMNLLTELHVKFPEVFYKADVIIVPIKLCKERNIKRDEFGCVPEKVIDHMVRNFQIPLKGEGFNEIRYLYPDQETYCDKNNYYYIADKYRTVDFYVLNSFDQDNPFHTMTLGQHMQATYEYVKKHFKGNTFDDGFWYANSLYEAARYHDIGKIITKDYHDRKGRPSKTAHYYGHENAGAYLILSEFPFIKSELNENYYINHDFYVKMATYVNFHMRVSFTWRQYPDGKCAKREKKLFNNYDLYCLELLGEADRQAH